MPVVVVVVDPALVDGVVVDPGAVVAVDPGVVVIVGSGAGPDAFTEADAGGKAVGATKRATGH